MAHHARIEEVSDSDPEDMDPADFDPSAQNNSNSLMSPANIPFQAQTPPPQPTQNDPKRFRHWTCLYPIYFDANRSRAEGRRVSKKLAVENPLAREICDAIFSLGLQMALEAGKTHPKDWANPGRVRVLLKEGGELVGNNVSNKHHLYIKVAEHLKQFPADVNTPMRLRLPGMPADAKPPPPPAIPRRWKMNQILPLHSAALSGGGVSENLFKDIMAGMQGQDSDQGAGGKANKKDKKKLKG